MLPETIANEFLDIFCDVETPYTGSISEWAHENISLPQTYAQPGQIDLSTSPWLVPPLEDIIDPKVETIIKVMAIRLGKSMTDEIAIPYLISQVPSPILRVHQDDDMAANITDTKLLPILRSTEAVSPLLPKHKGIKRGIIELPHMFIRISGDKETIGHSIGIRYLMMDEAHLYDVGLIEKFIGRTVDFAGRRKIIISSTPNHAGSELEKYYHSGCIYEWQWKCPQCQQYQPYYWSKQRPDNSYAGFTWDTILTEDGQHTDIAKSAKTTWLECYHCKHQIHDNIANRRNLNDNGKYVLIKSDGDPKVHAYTCPLFVNINLSFESFTLQYLAAKRLKRNTGLDQDIVTFVTQVLAKFYKADPQVDHSKIMRGDYTTDPAVKDKDWVRILTVDIQRTGLIKYWVIREWNKKGNESRRLDLGIARDWEEIEALRVKWDINRLCVGVDSGDQTTEVYQQCIKHGQAKKYNNYGVYESWQPLKGDGQHFSYKHPDGKVKYYSVPGRGDPIFPVDSKYRGLSAPFVLWSNWSIKSMLMKLRDNEIPGVTWLVDKKDVEYERHMYSEGIQTLVDKKTGLTVQRWIAADENHYLDCEAMNLVLAIKAGIFSPVKVDEDELLKIIPQNTTNAVGNTEKK